MSDSKAERTGYYPGKDVRNNVNSFLDRHLIERPDLIPLRWVEPSDLRAWSFKLEDPLPHLSVSLKDFEQKISSVAQGYLNLGIEQGDRVILFLPMSLDMYVAMFALQKIGAIAVFLDSWARRGSLGECAKTVSPKAMVSFHQAFEGVGGEPEIAKIPLKIVKGSFPSNVAYSATFESLLASPATSKTAAVEMEETALITFTTGSSGVPKGANRTHRFLAAQHYELHACIPYREADIDLPIFPIFSLNNLAEGVSTVIPALDVGVPSERDALILIAQMRANGVTCTTLSPSLLNGLSAYCLKNKISLPHLRRAATGGAPVSRDNLIDFTEVAENAEVWVLYGSTEAEPMAHIEAQPMIHSRTKASEDADWVDEGVNVGHLVDSLERKFLKINPDPITVSAALDWEALEVKKGAVGELIVAGEHVCRDYYNNAQAFHRAKIRDERGVVWHRTGDLGRLDEDGQLWIVGRVHNVIKRLEEYHFPVRAEIVLKKLPFVRYGAYLGFPDSRLGEKIVAVIVPNDAEALNAKAELEEYRSEVRRLMDKNGITVDEIVIRNAMPMDPRHHSKVEYDSLRREMINNGEVSGE
ncbi:MAG: AMP-binding protein [Cryobacterium sp.]|nr:AMP-binding protein [Oligoflexia bacterium]